MAVSKPTNANIAASRLVILQSWNFTSLSMNDRPKWRKETLVIHVLTANGRSRQSSNAIATWNCARRTRSTMEIRSPASTATWLYLNRDFWTATRRRARRIRTLNHKNSHAELVAWLSPETILASDTSKESTATKWFEHFDVLQAHNISTFFCFASIFHDEQFLPFKALIANNLFWLNTTNPSQTKQILRLNHNLIVGPAIKNYKNYCTIEN